MREMENCGNVHRESMYYSGKQYEQKFLEGTPLAQQLVLSCLNTEEAPDTAMKLKSFSLGHTHTQFSMQLWGCATPRTQLKHSYPGIQPKLVKCLRQEYLNLCTSIPLL